MEKEEFLEKFRSCLDTNKTFAEKFKTIEHIRICRKLVNEHDCIDRAYFNGTDELDLKKALEIAGNAFDIYNSPLAKAMRENE